jgi:hypothetical protein
LAQTILIGLAASPNNGVVPWDAQFRGYTHFTYADPKVRIDTQPEDAPGCLAPTLTHTFSVEASAWNGDAQLDSHELSYQWMQDGVPIFGAESASYTTAELTENESGVYTVEVKMSGATPVVSEGASLTVGDCVAGAPGVDSAETYREDQGNGTWLVTFTFSELVDTASATNEENYAVSTGQIRPASESGGITLVASTQGKGKTVTFYVDGVEGDELAVTVCCVTDLSGNEIDGDIVETVAIKTPDTVIPGPLTATLVEAGVMISWPTEGGGTLMQSDTVDGEYTEYEGETTDADGVTSTVITPEGGGKYYILTKPGQ